MHYSALKAIVIGAIPYSDSSKIVKILTPHGVFPLFVRLSKKGGNSFWHPLASLELGDVRRKNTTSLATCKVVERVIPSIKTQQDPKRTALAFFIAEVLEKSIQEGAQIDRIFEILEETVSLLESDDYVANLHFYTLARVVNALGLMPEKPGKVGMSLHLEDGEWYDANPLLTKNAYLLKFELAEQMIKIPGMDFVEMRNLSLNQNDRKELLLAMVMFIQLHHAGLREIKSYDVLETIFE